MAIAKVQTSAVSAFQGNSTTVVAGTATGYQRVLTVTAGSLLVARIAIRNFGATGDLISAVTDNLGQTWTKRQSKRDVSEDGHGWTYIYECKNAAAGSTTISLDCAIEDNNNYITWEVTEFSGIDISSPYDTGDADDVAGTAASITTGPVTPAQADSLLVAIVGGKWWYDFNSGGAAPSGWTLDAIATNNSFVCFQTVSLIVSSTTAQTITWTVPANQSTDDGGSACVAVFKAAAASGDLRVRALFDTAINSDTSITAYVWEGDPSSNVAQKFTGLTAESSGGVLLINLPSSTTLTNGQTVNVLAFNSTDTSGLITASVESY